MTRKELLVKLSALGKITDAQRNEIVCSLVGHSRIKTFCFGYFNCARCGAQVGDSLGGSYSGDEDVIVGHGCTKCHENEAKLTWRDTLFAPDPQVAA